MLYTGKGDSGTTKLFNTPSGERLPKTHPVFEALGTVDELVAQLGLLKVGLRSTDLMIGEVRADIVTHNVQEALFTLQAELAGAGMSIAEERVTELGALVDEIENLLPPIKTFFIAGATELSAQADVCRTISRRMERTVLHAVSAGIKVSPASLAYANRLSSLLYAIARFSSYSAGVDEAPPSYT
ncbi:MAG: cob(I)yrinic acid a,c-diamide adenosyltransferase [Candidatus Pacebacteria bacterium]|jgi:cob(I)alamin adenosyltransferase|nr:cob(I)yrinic acid a,c-diamide adenosyltransferase [Candidatus Paceibacterota bacterium]